MTVKAVELVRKIRDKHFNETKKLPVKKQIDYYKAKAKELNQQLKKRKPTVSH